MSWRFSDTSRLYVLLLGALILSFPLSVTGQTPTTEMTVISTHPHDQSAFTQGLEMHEGKLYESTGLYGQSSLRQVDPESGEVLRITMLEDTYFGEGITVVDDSIYMLSWEHEIALICEIETFDLVANIS